jgi:hypothetical protein
MKKNFYILFLAAFTAFSFHAQTQKCSSAEIYQQRAINNPELISTRTNLEQQTQNWIFENGSKEKTRNIITIPVVVHVIYKTTAQNVSDAQIQSQIDALNKDFRLFNTDSLDDSHPFWSITADSQIEFCLAQRDPQGNPTNGITRTQTSVTSFNGDESEKFTASGGKDGWNSQKYLNIWVCNLGGDLLGYATFPSDLSVFPTYDGVVINYTAFGTMGTAVSPNNKGRTGTHEVGHWLNLFHIWGDDACGDDLVADTEVAFESNYFCPSFPHNPNSTCGSSQFGEMYMNYMDYVDDACMVMFTFGQANRMRAALAGPRVGLLTSNGCEPTTNSLNEISNNTFNISPNPSESFVLVQSQTNNTVDVSILNILGEKVKSLGKIDTFPFEINIKDLPNGTYFINFKEEGKLTTEKIIISK